MLKNLLLLYTISSIFLFSCEKEDNQTDCAKDIICTQVFVTLTIPVEWVSMRPEAVVRSETIIAETGQRLVTFEDYQNNTSNPFYGIQVVNDLHIPLLKTNGTDLIIKVYGSSNNVISEFTYKAGHDCCHVVKIQGPDKISL